MNKELIEAINLLEKENNISKDVLLEAIENSLLTAYKNNYGRADNVKVNINRETGDFSIVAEREVVETVEDPMTQVSLAEAKLLNSKYELGDIVQFSVNSKSLDVSPFRTRRMLSYRSFVRQSATPCMRSGTAERKIS